MITVYQLDTQGLFIGNREIDPMGPLPLPMTLIAPPATVGDEVAQWDGLTWNVLAARPAPIAPPSPTAEDVNTERLRRIATGSAFTIVGVTDPIPLTGRPFDQTVYLALLTRAMALKSAGVTTAALTIRAQDDVIHTLTPDQMISLVSQAMVWFESVMAASWAMKDSADGIPADYTDDDHWP